MPSEVNITHSSLETTALLPDQLLDFVVTSVLVKWRRSCSLVLGQTVQHRAGIQINSLIPLNKAAILALHRE